ncbi:MAG: NERD domain-containing protein [Gammaproteobacteria bacterium]|nr:NERD domain-containing protein [Gammaproteobacteria bacterium]
MTDNELKALVAGLAMAQDRTDAQLAELAVAQDRTDVQLAKTDAQLAETAAQLAKTDAKLDRLATMYGGVGNNQGAVAEEFYYNSLKANPVLDGLRFDFVDKNVTRSHAGLEDEFDLLLVNGQTVFVVEVKYKAHEKDLERLLGEKAPNFQRLFPEHAGRRQRFALATFHLHDELKRAALEQGVSVLQRKGDVIETLAA